MCGSRTNQASLATIIGAEVGLIQSFHQESDWELSLELLGKETFSVGIAKLLEFKSGTLSLAIFLKQGKRFSENEVHVEESSPKWLGDNTICGPKSQLIWN